MNKQRGIIQRKNGKFEARVWVSNKGIRKNSRNKQYNMYVGIFPTKEEAISARIDYIRSLI